LLALLDRFALHSDAEDTLAGAMLQYDLGVVDVRSTMESLGVYLFAGAFRFLASASGRRALHFHRE
jgi:hypothetical protein